MRFPIDPVDAVAAVVEGYAASRRSANAIQNAEEQLRTALNETSDRVAFLEELARACEDGRVPAEATTRLLTFAARQLAGNVRVAEECSRILRAGSRKGR